MWTWEKIDQSLDRFAPALLGFLLIYAFARSVIAGTGKIYWYDELLTQIVTSQGSFSRIVAALNAPLDTQPPLYYLVERLASNLIPNQEIALRLPSAIGVVCTILCVFVFLRGSGRIVALLSSALVLMTAIFGYYAVEARPYSMTVACIAFALICYQRSNAPAWTALLGLSLALAQSFHYLAVVSMVPFGLAEIVETLRTRTVRWRVWLAFAAGALPLALSWHILLSSKHYYGPWYTSFFKFSDIPHVYESFLSTTSPIGMAIYMVAAISLLIVWRKPVYGVADAQNTRIGEPVLIAALVGLPFIGYAFALAAHTPIVPRYLLPGALGLSLGFGYVVARLPRQAILAYAAFILSFVAVAELHFWRTIGADRRDTAQRAARTASFVGDERYTDLQVVVPNGYILWMARHAAPTGPGRFVYLTKDTSSKIGTWDLGIAIAQTYLPIQVRAASDFIAANPKFLIYIDGDYAPDRWMTTWLVQQGMQVQLVKCDGLRELYFVQRP